MPKMADVISFVRTVPWIESPYANLGIQTAQQSKCASS